MSAGAAVETALSVNTASTTAPAKVNLTLDVLGPRSDGYHDLESLVIGVDLRDRLRCRLSKCWQRAPRNRAAPVRKRLRNGRESVPSRAPLGKGHAPSPDASASITCNEPSLAGRSNLAYRAAAALAERAGETRGVEIELTKCIPIGAGLGGGSSDAAAAIRLCNRLWGLNLDRNELAAVGASIGSDVPLFFHLPSAVIRGRGERVEPVNLAWSGWVLLVSTGIEVPTGDVYRAWCKSDGDQNRGDILSVILAARRAGEINQRLFNQLEPAVRRVCPEVAAVADLLANSVAGPWRISGAGSTFFRLFDERESALAAAESVKQLNDRLACTVARAPAGEDDIFYEEH